ncbi:hypothetical protein D3C87_75610 [compost metagenome]
MKKLTGEIKLEIAVQIGQLFDINGEGKELETLVNEINEKIEILNTAKPAKAGKWYENTELTHNEGDKVEAVDGWAKGRLIQIVKPSAKVDAFKGYLINPKDGSTQGTLVTVDAKDIKPYVEKVAEPVEEASEEEAV